MYSYGKDNDQESQTAKGVKMQTKKKDLKHDNYRNTLFNNQQLYHRMRSIRSVNHEIGSYEINKVPLSCFDDKIYILDGIKSYAYGHYRIKKQVQNNKNWDRPKGHGVPSAEIFCK